MKTEIHILIVAIEDLHVQIMVGYAFDQKLQGNKAIDFHEFINDLLDKNYYKLCEGVK